MSDPVKVSLLKAIETALKTVTGIKTVHRTPSTPIDRETAAYPFVSMHPGKDAPEERNRIVIITFPLELMIWTLAGATPIEDQGDILEAEIIKTMFTNTQVAYWSLRIKYAGSDYFYTDNELIGGKFIWFDVTYAYRYGDPYNPAKGV
ncbi:MAG: hypothetical protein FJ139_11720 [Deltaproteobacteria bacterium]|nr:hypothetical protein [Deltaproteobacteria bacterium]